jgi:transaldolase
MIRLNGLHGLDALGVRIFADGADLEEIRELAAQPYIKGVTTNPTLMRKAGITDYAGFARAVLEAVPDKPVSFEVFADDFEAMERQAREIARWGDNVIVKVPITNTKGVSAAPMIERLSRAGVRMNITAMMTLDQLRIVAARLDGATPAIVSIFAGRIADTGRDPVPIMQDAVALLRPHPNVELLWASPREVLNIVQADAIGCHIITLTTGLLRKMALFGKDLEGYSLETVEMFYRDAQAAGYSISVDRIAAAE